ncbi:MAG: magnesium transporter CorA family protein, partial [Alphaproteobacteria bacterium]|nr:magnesium transporter CorA family protein [Alphaproteobacteria bacterium]
MLRIYKSEDGGKLVKLKKNKVTPLSWYNMINPSLEEMEKVSEQLKLDSDMVKNALDLDERSRVEFEDSALSLIVNLPLLDDEGKFDTLPCDMFFTKRNFVTICSRDNRILSSFNKNTAKTFDTRERGRFLLSILSKCTQYYLKYLAIINQKTEEIEYSLRKTTKNKALFKLIEIQKSVVYF